MNEKDCSLTSKDGCNYKADCPIAPVDDVPICCKSCRESRKYFVTDSNKHLWNDIRGFHSRTGCRLSRDKMPPECLAYDCRAHVFVVKKIWYSHKWHESGGEK